MAAPAGGKRTWCGTTRMRSRTGKAPRRGTTPPCRPGSGRSAGASPDRSVEHGHRIDPALEGREDEPPARAVVAEIAPGKDHHNLASLLALCLTLNLLGAMVRN